MQHVLKAFSLVAIILFVFTACEKEEVNSGNVEENVEGEWNVSSVAFTSTTSLPDSSVNNLGQITFNAGGTGNTTASLIPGISLTELTTTNFVWTVDSTNTSNIVLQFQRGDDTIDLTYNARENEKDKQVWRIVSVESSGAATESIVQGILIAYNIDYTFNK